MMRMCRCFCSAFKVAMLSFSFRVNTFCLCSQPMSSSASRFPLREGWLEKKGGRFSKAKARWAVLSHHRLVLFESKDTDAEPRDSLDLCAFRSVKWNSERTFELCSASHSCSLRAQTKASAKEWVECVFAVAQSIRFTSECD